MPGHRIGNRWETGSIPRLESLVVLVQVQVLDVQVPVGVQEIKLELLGCGM